MGIHKHLETLLDCLLSYKAPKREMECRAYLFLMTHGHGFVDVAEVEDAACKVVSDYLRRHKWQRFRNWIGI